ncbi:hypothetical protein ACFFRL_07295 [Agromyces hippuratus]
MARATGSVVVTMQLLWIGVRPLGAATVSVPARWIARLTPTGEARARRRR